MSLRHVCAESRKGCMAPASHPANFMPMGGCVDAYVDAPCMYAYRYQAMLCQLSYLFHLVFHNRES